MGAGVSGGLIPSCEVVYCDQQNNYNVESVTVRHGGPLYDNYNIPNGVSKAYDMPPGNVNYGPDGMELYDDDYVDVQPVMSRNCMACCAVASPAGKIGVRFILVGPKATC